MNPHTIDGNMILDRGSSFRQYHRHDQHSQRSLMLPLPPVPAIDIRKPACFKENNGKKYVQDKTFKFFVPWDKLLHIISPNSVQQALVIWAEEGKLDASDIPSLRETICYPAKGSTGGTSYRKVLGILAALGMAEHILSFVRNGLDDSKLPLFPNSDRSQLLPSTGTDSTTNLEFLSDIKWSTGDPGDFFNNQFSFITPFFYRSDNCSPFHYRLHEHDILPFVEQSSWIRDDFNIDGPYPIKKIELHDQQYDFGDHGFEDPSQPTHLFAMKRLGHRRAFETEVECLKLTNLVNSDHLTRLMTSFELEGHEASFYLIFPWAECDLFSFWKHQEPNECQERWIAQQCRGLASALAGVHDNVEAHAHLPDSIRQYGRHGDLNPRNILWFPRHPKYKDTNGILVLSDFGHSQYCTRRARSAVNPIGILTAGSYRPPEIGRNLGQINRRFDIWCLGALYLEFVIWYLKGFEAVEQEFPEARSEYVIPQRIRGRVYVDCFYETQDDGTTIVKPAVKEWIDELKEHDRCSGYLQGLLRVIETEMLVVDASRRITARQVVEQLTSLETGH